MGGGRTRLRGRIPVPGVLLIFCRGRFADASTIMDHVACLQSIPDRSVWALNTEDGFPVGLDLMEFDAIVLHYSVFGVVPFALPERWCRYVEGSAATKMAFCQDEYQGCRERFALLDRLGVRVVFSLFEEEYFNQVYFSNSRVERVVETLAGYVPGWPPGWLERFSVPWETRTIDVGYRARRLPFYLGKGAQEKSDIADGFLAGALGHGLLLDISAELEDRIYGNQWLRFLGDCRFTLGVESGVSLVDLTGDVTRSCIAYLARRPSASFAEVERVVLGEADGRIPYRMISPRIFEAAALRVGLILFEGRYSGVVRPHEHYIPLNKDFSNLEAVIQLMRNHAFVSAMIDRAHRDLIASGRYGHEVLVRDTTLVLDEYRVPRVVGGQAGRQIVARALTAADAPLRGVATAVRYGRWPGKGAVRWLARRLGF